MKGLRANNTFERTVANRGPQPVGIAEQVARKTIILKTTAAVGSLVASGEAEIAILAIQHITFISTAGLELVGPLPREVQETMVFSAGILSAAVNRDAADALLAFLQSTEARTVMRAKGMEANQSHR